MSGRRDSLSLHFREEGTLFRVPPDCSGEHSIQWALLLMPVVTLPARGKGLGAWDSWVPEGLACVETS